MKKGLLFLVCFLSLAREITAQKHDYIWLNGQYSPTGAPPYYNFYFDFNFFPPEVAIDSAIMEGFYGQSLAMSDLSGNLQFYSSGCNLKNYENNTIEGGDSLNFGIVYNGYCPIYYPLSQGMLSIPAGNNHYDIFHFRVNIIDTAYYPTCTVRELLHTSIDMNANQGSGKATEKNQVIMTGCFQVLCANRHANGRDWWLLTADNKVDTFYRFLITPDGIQGPWAQGMENPSIDGGNFCGWTTFSPDGNRFVINACRFGVAVYDFDRCTGLLSNLRIAPRPAWEFTFGTTFSSNSRYLYIDMDENMHLDQFDLLAPDFAASQTTVAVWDGYLTSWSGATVFGPSYPGPDGKIYMGTSGFAHTVEYPNRPGIACKVVQRAIELPTAAEMRFMYFPNYRLGPVDHSSCDTLDIDNLPVALFRYETADTTDPLTLQFTDLSWYEPSAWHWSFGDGAMSSDTSPAHTYPAPGLYTVCLVVSNENAADTLCRQIAVGEVSSVHALPVLPRVSVSPNPFREALRIRLPARIAATPRFTLRDALGRPCASIALRDFETSLPLGHLAAGMYFWEVQINGVPVQAGKAVKMRE